MKQFYVSIMALFFLTVLSCKEENSIHRQFNLPCMQSTDQTAENFLPNLEKWHITVTDSSGQQDFFLDSCASTFELNFSSQEPVSVQAAPVNFGIEFFKPCGTIFPFSTNLSWSGGFAAQILKEYYLLAENYNSPQKTSDFSKRFNWNKLLLLIEEKDYSEYNPWNASDEAILSKLFAGKFTASCINQKGVHYIKKTEFIQNQTQILLLDYVPLNAKKIESIPLKQSIQNRFISVEEPYKIITATVDSKGKFLLATNSLPI